MIIANNTPFKHFYFDHWFPGDKERSVLIVQGVFRFEEGKPYATYVESDQVDIFMEDEFHDKPNESSLKMESNLVPFKRKTDVVINAVARSPDEIPLSQWNVGVEIKDKLSYGFVVRGESYWQKNKLGRKWHLTVPEKITELPVRYEYAYGGISQDKNTDEVVFQYNPVGCGFYTPEVLSENNRLQAHQIGDVAEFMQEDISSEMQVHGFGAVSKAWSPRRQMAGTFDASWQQERQPKMPEDYNLAYWNGAHGRLQVYPFLLGNETIRLMGLRHNPGPWELPLASGSVSITLHYEEIGSETVPLKLDTVYLDIADKDPQQHRLVQTWRLVFSGDYTVTDIEIHSGQLKLSEPNESKENLIGEKDG